MTRAEMMRSKSLFVQSTTSFMSEPMVSLNMLMSSFTDYKKDISSGMSKVEALKKHRTKIARVMAAYIMTAIAAGAIEGAMGAWRDDDDDEKSAMKKLKDNTISSMIDNLRLYNKIPYVKDAITIFQGFDVNRMDTEFISSAAYAVKRWEKRFEGKETMLYGDMFYTVKALSQATGLPFGNAMREVENVWNNTVAEMYPQHKLRKKVPKKKKKDK